MHLRLLAIALLLLGSGALLLQGGPSAPDVPREGTLPSPAMTPTPAPIPITSPGHPARTEERVAPPVGLQIPALGLRSEIVRVSVNRRTGLMAVPPSAADVAWYGYGSAPGEPGSAVLAGHVDFDGRPGAFFRLADLHPGDRVVVEDRRGRIRRFRVAAVRSYAKDRLPARLFARSGAPLLTLITCGGAFDLQARSYARNIVVVAEPI